MRFIHKIRMQNILALSLTNYMSFKNSLHFSELHFFYGREIMIRTIIVIIFVLLISMACCKLKI